MHQILDGSLGLRLPTKANVPVISVAVGAAAAELLDVHDVEKLSSSYDPQ